MNCTLRSSHFLVLSGARAQAFQATCRLFNYVAGQVFFQLSHLIAKNINLLLKCLLRTHRFFTFFAPSSSPGKRKISWDSF